MKNFILKIINSKGYKIEKIIKDKKNEGISKQIASKDNALPIIREKIQSEKSNEIFHVSAFTYGNAGDTILPIALQDTWNNCTSSIKWINQHVYTKVDDNMIDKINHSKGVIIGGGGLFLKDTNTNDLSGWQWPCSIEMLNKIEVPIVFYAVGYNRFRGQEEFEPYFKENLIAFAKKSVYLGIRNTGSIESIKKYLPTNLHNKVRFQPCMTTFLSELYPDLTNYEEKEDFIAINAAFDRSHLRFGEKIGKILNETASALKKISKDYPIKFYSHMPSDEAFLPFLQSFGVKYEIVRLSNAHPKKIIGEYAKPRLVVGMRGHAQMVPFGCKTPIASIVSHNKLQWFLDDIGQPNWGADVLSPTYKEDLENRIFSSLENTQKEIDFISRKQKELYKTSIENVEEGLKSMNLK